MDVGLNNRNYLHKVFDNQAFEDVEWLIEANSNEQFNIWQDWHNKLGWKEVSLGYNYTIKELECEGEKLPLVLSFSFAIVNGSKVAFVDCCSMLKHSGYVEAFLTTYFQRTHDKYSRWNHTDATNAHNCLNYLDSIDIEPRDTMYIPEGYTKKYFTFKKIK